MPSNSGKLLRWWISSATLGVPQAGGPVAFAFVALSLTGGASGGAAMMLAMTLAQVIGAIPIVRLGRNLPVAKFLKILVSLRTVALAAIGLLVACDTPFLWLIPLAAIAGSVNGAATGYLRALLGHLAPAEKLPRALGIAATLNELTFVLTPVAASGLGTVSPVLAVLALAALGAVPVLLVPHVDSPHPAGAHHGDGSVLSRPILLWLLCAASGGATVAAIEIGAVLLALNFGYEPALAIMFTVPLCVASVSGGIWVSVRNRMATRNAVLAYLVVMMLGSALVALNLGVATSIVGTVLIGSVLAPLATHYSLILDTLAPPQRRAEVFALLRTANAMGVIFTSALLAVASLSAALIVVTGLMIVAASAVAIASAGRGRATPP
jgi:hypothetical protein